MNRLTQIALAAVVCTGCSNSSSYSQRTPGASSPPPAAAQTDFSSFVLLQFSPAASADTATAVDVETTNFAFADDDNPAVFAPLLVSVP